MAAVKFPITPECRLLLIIAWVSHAVTIFTLGLRFVVRVRKRMELGWDDFFSSFATMCTTAFIALFSAGM